MTQSIITDDGTVITIQSGAVSEARSAQPAIITAPRGEQLGACALRLEVPPCSDMAGRLSFVDESFKAVA
jgi:hypothetical protein